VKRALLDRDLERCRAALPDDIIFHDHRRAGAGRLEGPDAYVAWLAALFELSPDAIIETLYYVAVEQHGSLAVGRVFGTLTSGGEFESVFARLMLLNDGRTQAELFELEDLDVARARLDAAQPPSPRAGR
jgi:ketosteroid isomerase-like protein